MQVFDFKAMTSRPYSQREKNVFYQGPHFKARIIELPAGGSMPTCHMPSYVLFHVITGEVEVQVNGEAATLKEGQCLITEPATVSMKTEKGVRIMGIQVAPR